MTKEEKKESKKAYDKIYRENNKTKMKAYDKEYIEKHKGKKKATMKVYNEKPENIAKQKANYEKNKEKLKAKYEKNKEEIKANYEKNKEKLKAIRDKPENKAKSQTPERIKSRTISTWKHSKIISDDWDATYDWVMNTKNCQKCHVLLENGTDKNGKCLDHDHTITDGPNTRAVLCWSCNIHEGKKRRVPKEEYDKHRIEKIKCVCGSFISRSYMYKHKKSAKHINFHIN